MKVPHITAPSTSKSFKTLESSKFDWNDVNGEQLC